MPELPEVETTRRGIEPWARGRTLADVIVRNGRLRWPVEAPDSLKGATIDAVNRRGKYLLIGTTSGTLIVHLGMSGSLRVVGHDEPAKTHDHIDLVFDEHRLRFNDPRRFGCLLHTNDDPATHWLLKNLGVEPLGNEFSGGYLFTASRKRKVAVKNFIMDAKVVVGVGNIYAAEALFQAGIRPGIAAGSVSRAGYEQLAQAIQRVLQDALEMGGTTLRDFVGSDGNPGYFKQKLFVYGRDGEPCRVCGSELKLKQIGQRSSVYCPKCQTSQGFKAPSLPPL